MKRVRINAGKVGLVFKNGEVVDKQVGAVPKGVLAGKLDAQLN